MIEVKNLSKRFRISPTRAARKSAAPPADSAAADRRQHDGWFKAVSDVGFACQNGEVLGLLGPNGAGKTTTLRLLSTALAADSGSVMLDGVDLLKEPQMARQKIGFLSGSTGLYGRLSTRENVEYFGRLHRMAPAQLKARIDDLFTLLNMHDFAERRADQLSTGMKQKCAIARAVVHHPAVVILDEPTTGLDVMAAQTLLDFIASYKVLGIPLIFSTHHLHEVEKLCDRVCIINHGRTAFFGSLAELRHRAGRHELVDAFVRVIEEEQ
jgi:sodium transport system ATP-binding protein